MNEFEALFGVKESSIKETCVVLPFLNNAVSHYLDITQCKRGKMFGVAQGDGFSAVHTGVGPAFLGDAVLYLAQSPCRNLILFGSCGLVCAQNGLTLGSLVAPYQCYAYESFTELLIRLEVRKYVFFPQRQLLENFLKAYPSIKKVTCASVGSLKLEAQMLPQLTKKRVEVLDMECAAFFAAAAKGKLRAMALFYVTDILNEKPFYTTLRSFDTARLHSSIQKASLSLCDFVKTNLRA